MNNELIEKYIRILNKDGKFQEQDIWDMIELCVITFNDMGLGEEKYNLALVYLAMHELTINSLLEENDGDTTSIINSVSSQKAGDLQVSYGSSEKRSEDKNYYFKTPYGIKWWQITHTACPFIISSYRGD